MRNASEHRFIWEAAAAARIDFADISMQLFLLPTSSPLSCSFQIVIVIKWQLVREEGGQGAVWQCQQAKVHYDVGFV